MQIKSVLCKYDLLDKIIEKIQKNNVRTRYSLDLPYKISGTNVDIYNESHSSYLSTATDNSSSRGYQTPLSTIATNLDTKINHLLKGISNIEKEAFVIKHVKLGHNIIYSFLQLYNKYICDNAELMINIESKNRKKLESMYDAEKFQIMYGKQLARELSLHMNARDPVSVTSPLQIATNIKEKQNSKNVIVPSNIIQELNESMEFKTPHNNINIGNDTKNVIDSSNTSGINTNNIGINNWNSSEKINIGLDLERSDEITIDSIEERNVSRWDVVKYKSFASKELQVLLTKAQTEFDSMNNLIKYQFEKNIQKRCTGGSINGASSNINDEMEWLLEKLIETMESAIREISILMNDSYIRFQLNNKQLFDKVVQLAQEKKHNLIDK